MIKGIFFDAAGVFYDRKQPDSKYASGLLKQSGYATEITAEAQAHLKALRTQATEGRLTPAGYWDHFMQMHGVQLPDQRKEMVEQVLEHAHQVFTYPGGREAIGGLKARGFILGIITDTMWSSEWKRRWLAVAGVDEFFDVFVSSAELGVHKPDPAMYTSALQRAHLAPSEAAFVGHDARELEGARRAGIATVAVNYDPDAKADYYARSLVDLLNMPLFDKCFDGFQISSTGRIPMPASTTLSSPDLVSEILFEKMKRINPGIEELELYEFRYALDNLYPANGGWACVELAKQEDIEKLIDSPGFYTSIQIKPQVDDRIVLDPNIVRLTNMLFVGLVTGEYSEEWVRAHFHFDIRGFYFLTRTVYFTDPVLAHLGGKPYKSFEQKQKRFEHDQSVGYKAFKEANAEVDEIFIESVKKLIAVKGTPILLAIAGPTAAGKTEIVARLRSAFEQAGKQITSIELDNFLTDRDDREAKGIHSLGKPAIHFELFKRSLEEICQGHKITIPRYDFIYGTSSHDLDGNLKAGGTPLDIEPADIIFIEGNFPFLLKEVVHLIGIKVVYLTDDAIRLKRKWKRDIDYRKKYEPTYFRNRFFKDQFSMAQKCYRPQMEMCDLVVDTTGAALWVTPEIAEILNPA